VVFVNLEVEHVGLFADDMGQGLGQFDENIVHAVTLERDGATAAQIDSSKVAVLALNLSLTLPSTSSAVMLERMLIAPVDAAILRLRTSCCRQ
jgi:hypothetical protein